MKNRLIFAGLDLAAKEEIRVKKITPRRVRIKCENCGEFNTTQRYDPNGMSAVRIPGADS